MCLWLFILMLLVFFVVVDDVYPVRVRRADSVMSLADGVSK